MLYVLAVALIAAWVYLTALGFRLNREGAERAARGLGATPDPALEPHPAQAASRTPVTG